MFNRILQSTAMIAVLGCGPACASPVFAVAPGPIQGAPGTTVGWGFSIVNDTPYWLLLDSSQFCQAGQDPLYTTCTTTLGSPTPDSGFTDLIATNATVIDPLNTLSISYDPILQDGLGTYTINPDASLYSVDTGTIVLTYVEFSGGSPFTTGTPVSGDIELGLDDLPGGASSGAASVEVVPEPATLLLGWLSLVAFLCFGRFSRRCRL